MSTRLPAPWQNTTLEASYRHVDDETIFGASLNDIELGVRVVDSMEIEAVFPTSTVRERAYKARYPRIATERSHNG